MSQEHAKGKGKDSKGEDGAQPAAEDPAHQQHKLQVAQWRREFQQLTGVDPADGEAVKAWQSKHGVPPTGLVRAKTIAAARAAAKSKSGKKADGDGGADAFGGEGVAEDGPVLENPVLMDNVTGGAAGMEKHDKGEKGEGIAQAGEGAAKGGEGLAQIGVIPETPWIKAAAAPHIVDLLRRGEIAEAVKAVASEVGHEKALEGLAFVARKLGMHAVAEAVEKFVEGAAFVGLEVLIAQIKWTYQGFKMIHEAHERGDRDSRIAIYASAFADAFLYGEGVGGNLGAVTEEQKEAAELGRKDGAATAGATGEQAAAIGKALLKKYGSARGARQGIINELMKKAGISGVTV